jgi:lipoate-protein ligase A
MIGRILPHEAASGAANMALDEALLEEVASDPSHAYIRTYEWSTPTLSLGYFQRIADAESDPRFREVPIVRRATGGGALWHDLEITYSVVIPAQHPLSRRAQELYRAIHWTIGRVIEERGIEVARRGDKSIVLDQSISRAKTFTTAARPFLCFADRDPEDLVSHEIKIVGSAQRRRVGAVLQHGSVLLSRSTVTPELPGISDLLERPEAESPSSWSIPIVESIARTLDLLNEAVEIPERIRQRAQELEKSIYSNDGWTRRR